MAGENITGAEGMGAAREAFQSAMDAETPSRSKTARSDKKPERLAMEDLFPAREMDRSEREGALDEGTPAAVKKARDEARARGERVLGDKPRRGRQDFGEVEDAPAPRDPIEGDDEDEPELPLDEDEADLEEGADEEQAEDEDDGSGEPVDLKAIVEVNIDGETAQVSLEEAVRGYIRQETFHRRMGELQQGVTALQTARTELDTHRQSFLERAEALDAYVQAFMPQEPDWDQIYAADPAEGARLERRWRTFQKQVEDLQQKRAETQTELQRNANLQLHQFAQANRVRMISDHPEWRDEKAWKRDHDSMRRTARAEGYSDEEINQLYDARGVNVLLKASKYDRLMASKPKPVRNGFGNPAKTNGATPRQRNASRSFDRAEKRLSRVGTVDAAANVFERILDREK